MAKTKTTLKHKYEKPSLKKTKKHSHTYKPPTKPTKPNKRTKRTKRTRKTKLKRNPKHKHKKTMKGGGEYLFHDGEILLEKIWTKKTISTEDIKKGTNYLVTSLKSPIGRKEVLEIIKRYPYKTKQFENFNKKLLLFYSSLKPIQSFITTLEINLKELETEFIALKKELEKEEREKLQELQTVISTKLTSQEEVKLKLELLKEYNRIVTYGKEDRNPLISYLKTLILYYEVREDLYKKKKNRQKIVFIINKAYHFLKEIYGPAIVNEDYMKNAFRIFNSRNPIYVPEASTEAAKPTNIYNELTKNKNIDNHIKSLNNNLELGVKVLEIAIKKPDEKIVKLLLENVNYSVGALQYLIKLSKKSESSSSNSEKKNILKLLEATLAKLSEQTYTEIPSTASGASAPTASAASASSGAASSPNTPMKFTVNRKTNELIGLSFLIFIQKGKRRKMV
jgi:hypothetical protein